MEPATSADRGATAGTREWNGQRNISLAGAATSIIFGTKHVFCRDKSKLAVTKLLGATNTYDT